MTCTLLLGGQVWGKVEWPVLPGLECRATELGPHGKSHGLQEGLRQESSKVRLIL